eukprot:Seg417.15 transcript_id=Seg417.15/GoldUCD/mRNA.D3Y31 product="Integrator complex subunit 10" protein_id=Seg417.15/GoldUCD/D3Y31
MKGPEEKEQQAGCSPEWLVEKSRDALALGDLYAAKSWILTAKTLYPKAFLVQYEAFLMEKRTGKLSTCGKLFFEMIKTFQKEELLWKELRKLVQALEVSADDLDAETIFLKEMCESLPLKYQRELLLRYADNQLDLIERCRISLVVMKKFHGGTRQYGVKLTELLIKAEREEKLTTPLNIYRKMLVCDVLPVILKSQEIHVDALGVKHKASVVYLPEQLLFTWLELCIEFYASLSIHQSTLKYRHFGRASDGVLEPNMSLLDPDGDIGQNPWLSLHEVLLLFAVKCNWSNVLKIKDKLDPGKSRSIKSKWRAISNAKDVKSPWGIFYSVLELYLHAVIEYCSLMVSSQKGQMDASENEFLLLENIDQLGQKDIGQQSFARTPKKKRKLEDGSASSTSLEFQVSIEDVHIQFSSLISGQHSDLSDILQVAVDCKHFLTSNQMFERENARIISQWCVQEWKWMAIFKVDSLLYQRKYSEVIEAIKEQQANDASKGASSNVHLAKQYTQLAVSLYCTGKHKETCQMAIDAIYSICEIDVTEVRSKEFKCALSKGNIDGRFLQILPCSPHEITEYCIELLILTLKEKLANVDIRPDSDKIGPLYDVRQDNIIGHLIVLLQYNWPKGEALFEQLVKTITTLGGLRYERFFSYVTNIDILEEFSYLNTLEKVQLELQDMSPGELSRKTVTRGVNRENKEDFKSLMDAQISRDEEPIQNIILRFLKDEQQNLFPL